LNGRQKEGRPQQKVGRTATKGKKASYRKKACAPLDRPQWKGRKARKGRERANKSLDFLQI